MIVITVSCLAPTTFDSVAGPTETPEMEAVLQPELEQKLHRADSGRSMKSAAGLRRVWSGCIAGSVSTGAGVRRACIT